MAASYRKKEQRLECAKLWLRRSRRDYQAFKLLVPFSRQTYKSARSSDPALAVYLLQQSLEKAVKAAAIASGKYTLSRMRYGFSHNSYALLLDFFLKVDAQLRKTGISQMYTLFGFTTEGVESKLKEEKRKALTRRGKPQKKRSQALVEEQDPRLSYEYKLGRASPDLVLAMLEVVHKIRNDVILGTIREVWGPHAKRKIRSSDISVGSVNEIVDSFQKIWTTTFERPPLTRDELITVSEVAKLVEQIGVILDTENGSGSAITLSRNTEEYLGMWSIVSLVILAALTFPHENSSRYPLPPLQRHDAPTVTGLSCEDYTNDLGIVEHIGYFGYTTGLVLSDMESMLEPIASFFAFGK